MELNWIALFFLWYGCLSLAYVPITHVEDSASINYDLTDDLNGTYTEDDAGAGVGDVIGGIFKFFGFLAFGVGLPSGIPNVFSVGFAIFQTLITFLLIAFIVSSVWDG